MQTELANGVSGNPQNIVVKIKSHEKTQSHLDGEGRGGEGRGGEGRGGEGRGGGGEGEGEGEGEGRGGEGEGRGGEGRGGEGRGGGIIKSINAVNEITQHAISFTLFGTLVIFGTPLYDL